MRRYNAELLKMIKSVGLTESYNELRTCTAEELLPILAEFDNQQYGDRVKQLGRATVLLALDEVSGREKCSKGGEMINNFKVKGWVKSEKLDCAVPLVDIPLMSDERWNELAKQNAVANYIRAFGRHPESPEAAVSWQRGIVRSEKEKALV